MGSCTPRTMILDSSASNAKLLRQLTTHLQDEKKLLQLASRFTVEDDYPLMPNSYTRNILYRDANGSQVMVARWDKDASTAIHGHPQYTFVQLLKGRLLVDTFESGKEGLQMRHSAVINPGQHLYHVGKAGRFDNAIHRVKALQHSLSLHVYSDDALKGIIY